MEVERVVRCFKSLRISASGRRPLTFAHDPNMVAARVESLESECRMRETVRRPPENARSISVEVAGMN
jgi:hypothetical protein